MNCPFSAPCYSGISNIFSSKQPITYDVSLIAKKNHDLFKIELMVFAYADNDGICARKTMIYKQLTFKVIYIRFDIF